ncbi:MAG: MFS transporter [Anaerolineaceae bacterium]
MSESTTTPVDNSPVKRPTALILLIFIAFIALGMPDGLLGVGWPTIRADFGIPLDAIGMLLFASLAGYLTSSFFSGAILRRWNVGKVLIVSCMVSGVGLVGYTLVPQWWMMVSLGVLAGLGAGTIDAGLNAYVANHFGPGLMQWLHASYGIGVTTGPLLMTYFVTQAAQWRSAYLVVGGFQLVLSIVFVLTLPLWAANEKPKTIEQAQTIPVEKTRLFQTLRTPEVWLSGALFFLYVGSEVMLGTWTFSLLTEARGVTPELAGLFAGSYWFSFTIGRVLAGLVTRKLRIERLVFGSLMVAVAGAVLLVATSNPWASLVAVALIGFAFAPIFPGFVTGTARRVGQKHHDNAIGIQIAIGGIGGSALTSLVGVLARRFGLEVMPVALLTILVLLSGLYWLSTRKDHTNL